MMVKRSALPGWNAGDAALASVKGRVQQLSCILVANLSRLQQVN